MALDPANHELFATESRDAVHGIHSTRNATVLLATGSGTLAIGQVMAQLDDGGGTPGAWVPYDEADANGGAIPRGVLVVEAVTLDASDEVLGVVMMEGEVNIDDLVFGGGGAKADFIASQQAGSATTVAPTLRELGIVVRGVDGIG